VLRFKYCRVIWPELKLRCLATSQNRTNLENIFIYFKNTFFRDQLQYMYAVCELRSGAVVNLFEIFFVFGGVKSEELHFYMIIR
jgi:hypothetical protein